MPRKKKVAPRFVVRSLLICDDIREERSGKQIIIGVYTGFIGLHKLPARLDKLLFRIDVQFFGPRPQRMVLQIRDEKNECKMEVTGQIPQEPKGEAGVFVFGLSNIKVIHPAWMNVWLGVDADEPIKIGGVEIRSVSPENEKSQSKKTQPESTDDRGRVAYNAG